MKKSVVFILFLAFSSLGLQATSFELKNTSVKPVKLKIPRVMTPSLAPLSSSTVDLKPGQKVFFYHKNKKYLLFKVTKDMEGKSFQVNKLIRERKRELGLVIPLKERLGLEEERGPSWAS